MFHAFKTAGRKWLSNIFPGRSRVGNFYSAKAATKAANELRDGLVPNPKGRLKEQFHEVCRFKHLAVRSEEAYWANEAGVSQ